MLLNLLINMKEYDAKQILNDFMTRKGFRRRYQLAKYLGVSPQAVSIWQRKNDIPPRHLINITEELGPQIIHNYPEPIKSSKREMKTVIEFLVNENVHLKRTISKLNNQIAELLTKNKSDGLFEKINANTLLMNGRISDGVITNVSGNWKSVLGYKNNDLIGHCYDEEFLIHPDDIERTMLYQKIFRRSTGFKESRHSAVQRWKHNKTGKYIMLSIVFYVNIEKDQVDLVAKPIDTFLGENSKVPTS